MGYFLFIVSNIKFSHSVSSVPDKFLVKSGCQLIQLLFIRYCTVGCEETALSTTLLLSFLRILYFFHLYGVDTIVNGLRKFV